MNCPKCNANQQLQSGSTSLWSCGTQQGTFGIRISPECLQRQLDASKSEIMDLRAKQIAETTRLTATINTLIELTEGLLQILPKEILDNEIPNRPKSQS